MPAPTGITRLANGQVRIEYDDGSEFFALPVIPLAEDGSFQTSSKDAGGPGGGVVGAMTVANGQDVTQGATTDPAVTTDSNGTISGKLRGLVKLLADVWDGTNHRLRVDGSGVIQGVSATSLPLPVGAATAVAQIAQTAVLTSIDGDTAVLGFTTDAAVEDTTAPSTLAGRLTAATHFLAQLRDQVSGGHVSGNLDEVARNTAAAASHTAARLTVATGSASLAARPGRTRLLLSAPSGNAADIVIEASGYHLEKGTALALRVVDAFAFTGTDGDHLDLIEEYN